VEKLLKIVNDPEKPRRSVEKSLSVLFDIVTVTFSSILRTLQIIYVLLSSSSSKPKAEAGAFFPFFRWPVVRVVWVNFRPAESWLTTRRTFTP
jgi:hypothetical protein